MAASGPVSKPLSVAQLRLLLEAAAEEDRVPRSRLNRALPRSLTKKAKDAAVEGLLASGLLQIGGQSGRTVYYRLTPQGREALLDRPIGPQVRLSGRQVNVLLGLLRATPPPAPPTAEPAPASVEYPRFCELLLDAHAGLSSAQGFGRSVAIHQLRHALRSVPREVFDEHLTRMATEGLLYFEKLTDYTRSTEEQRRDSLHHPVTGLLFYATVRRP